MRVVLDGVFNHASRGFWPFHHVMETGADSPYRDWFHFDDAALEAGRPLRAYPEDPHGLDTAECLRTSSVPAHGRSTALATGPGGTCRPCRS